jgi:hypothetical protein
MLRDVGPRLREVGRLALLLFLVWKIADKIGLANPSLSANPRKQLKSLLAVTLFWE